MINRFFVARNLHFRYMPVLVNIVLAALWLWLYRAVFPYLKVIFSREEFRTNQIVLLGVLALVMVEGKKNYSDEGLPVDVNRLPQLTALPLGIALGGSILYLLVEHFFDINTLSAALFGLASYGLLGLWMHPGRWRKGLPAALLLVGALPFGEHLQTFIGYPVRILTASIVRDGLAAAGVQTVNLDTILVFENGISKVDLPCSGVKSLWSGGLFFLAATWIDRRSLNLRWALAGLGFAFLLLAANLLRVAVLVTVGQVAGWRLLAEMLHVPLGVAGFVAACLLALLLLRWDGQWKDGTESFKSGYPTVARPQWLGPALCAVVAVMAMLYTPRPEANAVMPALDWQFFPSLVTEAWPLEAGEREWLQQAGAQSVERRRFTWRGRSGSILLVSSTSWRAQHRPERCFEVYGLGAEESRTELVALDFPVRLLSLGESQASLGGGDRKVLLSAAYWFQSAGQATDDYATRIWDDLSPQRQTWVLVTILFDSPLDPASEDTRELYLVVRDGVQKNLLGGTRQ